MLQVVLGSVLTACLIGVGSVREPVAADRNENVSASAADQQPDRSGYAARLAALKDQGWREAFALGQEIAGLPPEQGWAIIRDAWPTLEPVHARQQMLKAWYFRAPDGKSPMGLTPRGHPRLPDVLELGLNDRSPDVQQWAADFLKKSGGGEPAAPANRESNRPPKPAEPIAGDPEIDIADLRAGGDDLKRYILIGPRAGAREPADGWKLLLVLPGGDGSSEFHPFVRNIAKQALPDGYLVAQLVAPVWRESEERVAWPTKGLPDDQMKFSTEEFIAAVIDDAASKKRVDGHHIYALGWSSGGPPVYAASVTPGARLDGALVAMSVYKPDQMPPLTGANGKAYYLLHSPEDFIRMSFPEAAKKELTAAGAAVELQTYEGGHGWHGDVFANIRRGVEWLEARAQR